MINKMFILFILMASPLLRAEQADDHQLIRRLYLDVVGRLPEVSEFLSAEKTISSNNGYSKLVNQLLSTQEFKENLSFHIARHYGPGLSVKDTIGMERARQHIEQKYLKTNKQHFANGVWCNDATKFEINLIVIMYLYYLKI